MTPFLRAGTRTLVVALALTATRAAPAYAQSSSATTDFPPNPLPLTDLSAFRGPSPNWRIVGGAAAPAAQGTTAFSTSPGSGVLAHLHSDAQSPLATTWGHGDIDLSFDVMLSAGAKARALLMGRYGVELSDSWMRGGPVLAVIGAVSPRWSDARGKGQELFEGTPPRLNAGRAPGLWQHVDLIFRAPRFAGGSKVANARFASVRVNGVLVQENVQVTGPTRGSIDGGELASGPLVFDGSGDFAIRNIRFKSYTGAVALSRLGYRVYEGEGMDASYAASHAPTRSGTTGAMSADVAVPQDKFAVAYDGTLTAPAAGKYRFGLSLGWIGNDATTRGAAIGGGVLSVDGKPVVTHTGAERRAIGDVELAAGAHAVTVTYYKNRPQFNRRDVSVTVEGPGVERQSLTDDSGARGDGNSPTDPIMVDAESQSEPVMLRSFMRHRDTKRVLAMSVGDPRGVHYTYDLGQGSLLYVWRGPFLEATQMWHERGEDQTAEPIGSVVTLNGTPAVAHLSSATAPWPDSLDDRQLHRDGYQLDKTGHPTFLYRVDGVSVEDAVRADLDGLTLRRELRLRPTSTAEKEGLYVQLAAAEHIVRQADGSYVVGDRSYYIKLPTNAARPIVRRVAGKDELMVPVRFSSGEATVSYSIVW